MGRTKSNIYEQYLEFDSVKQYLRQSINAKSGKIDTKSTLEEIIDGIDLSQYLRGLVIFLEDYFEPANNPYELIQYIENMGNDKTKINEFVKTVDNFVAWLKAKGYADKTVLKYQAHPRAFIHKNHFGFSFKNFDADSERQIKNEKNGIDTGLIKEILYKLPEYTNDYYLKMLMEGMQKTGLGRAELRSLTFGDLRYRFKNGNGDEQIFTKVEKRRKKNNKRFLTYLYGDYKRKIIKHLEMHPKSEYPDNKTWLVKSDHAFTQSFNLAYEKLIKQEYPELLIYETKVRKSRKTGEMEEYESLQKVATLHWFRHVFCGSADAVGVPKGLTDLFVGHKGSDAIERIYHEMPNKQKLEYFKKIQEELFGVRESSTREQIEKEIIDRLMENLLNKGKRQTIFYEIDENPEQLGDETTDRKMGYFIQKILATAEDNAKERLMNDEEFQKSMFKKFEEKLLEKYELIPKS